MLWTWIAASVMAICLIWVGAHFDTPLAAPIFTMLALRYLQCCLQILYLRLKITHFLCAVCAFLRCRCLRFQMFCLEKRILFLRCRKRLLEPNCVFVWHDVKSEHAAFLASSDYLRQLHNPDI
jgi:hypothetical protein